MSLKAIEMQIALPRTQDVGKIQEQLQQRSQLTHDLAAREMQKETEKKEHTITKYKQKEEVHLKQDHSSQQYEQSHSQHDNKKESAEKAEKVIKQTHPYKGNSIDFSG
ncbi:hypothetical protein [Bacillus massiliigorillae]|uniref:hypothetical protein n=1 Tax=Bacillus massiliigorillae TaxID=1243664 RepID=UPI0003A4AFC5|nr:hypothetical protein [Bacillus massiliigorillae]